jgi:MerR family transcriptional regulator, redox-sensitive transcriptional activator SoxR
MERLSIGEVARRVGVRPSAIRFYESAGLLAPPERSSGWRSYEPSVVERLQVIRSAREIGFSLDEIRQLLDGFSPDVPPSERWRALAAEKLPEVHGAIRRATALKRLLVAGMSCRCVSIEECFLEDCAGGAATGRALPIITTPSAPAPPDLPAYRMTDSIS